MENKNEIKSIVKEKYASIARKSASSCCGPATSCCDPAASNDYSLIGDKYSDLKGYVPDADLGLGCGLPTEYSGIEAGHAVIDLGSGAGNDVFVARSLVGENGRVIGVDMTDDMIDLANKNNQRLGYENVSFVKGDIENLPLEQETGDVVISNCVLNLVPDKEKAFAEIFRVLKTGGHFCVSDIVLTGELPDGLRRSAEMYAGCVAGALLENDYLDIIKKTGFSAIKVHKRKKIDLPDNQLREYLTEAEISAWRNRQSDIVSITVTAHK